MSDLTTRESKLVQYLNEAYGKEKELETALTAHIGMTTRTPYRKRLREHLTETKRHARELEKQVKKLGGTPQIVPIEGFDPIAKGAGTAVEIAGRAAAAVQGPLHALRGTSEQEKMLKNAKSEYADEHEEIATYTAIEALAEGLGAGEVARLARAIRRDEERMARFLERLIPALTKAVVQAEVPASERRNGSAPPRRSTASSRRSSASASRGSSKSASRSRTPSSSRRSAGSASRRRSPSAAGARSTASNVRASSKSTAGRTAAKASRTKR
jgi:ferritin-like metal-binding protein YciE